MFKRVFSVVLLSILTVTLLLTTMSYVRQRDEQINNRLELLKLEARDIAYLAAQESGFAQFGNLFPDNLERQRYLQKKTEQVHEEYGGFILVVDRRGRMMDNLQEAYEEDPELVENLRNGDFSETMQEILKGKEISVRSMNRGDPTFTVGVPFVQNGMVLGAVFIQTGAQVIEGGLGDLLVEISLAALAVALIAALILAVYMRKELRPLHQVTDAARRMAEGDFTATVEPAHSSPEVAELTRAFNIMSGKLRETENSRREFVANVSHELRSPMTSISGFVEGMRDGTIPREEFDKYLGILSDETNRLKKLIGDLLALSRLEKEGAQLEMAPFDICELIRRCLITRMQDIDEKEMEIECDFQQDSMGVLADPDRIKQVIVNLLDNALKFTPDHGCITFRCLEEGKSIRVTVADNGPSVPEEDRGKVFDRFFTVDRAHTSGKGTGLGLSICQRILQMHGRIIQLDETAEGASFSFTLERVKLSEGKNREGSGMAE